MNEVSKAIIIAGALCAMLGVIFGAFGAHALKKILSADLLAVHNTAVLYQFIHALGLILVGVIHYHYPTANWLTASAVAIFTGIVLFSGSLYAVVLSGISRFGMVTPLGGIFFILGWLFLAIAIYKIKA